MSLIDSLDRSDVIVLSNRLKDAALGIRRGFALSATMYTTYEADGHVDVILHNLLTQELAEAEQEVANSIAMLEKEDIPF